MNHENKLNHLRQIISTISEKHKEMKPSYGYRFDIFKGTQGVDGKITKVRSVGSAYVKEGHRTYTVSLKTFLSERYFLLPNSKPEKKADFVILTRENAQNIARKYFWNSVGDGKLLDGLNHGLMKLTWDVLSDDLYMCLHPMPVQERADSGNDEAA